jgi:gamma-glutamyltranspeptidase / glutathione hydrolase
MEKFTARPELCGTFGAAASTHWIASACAMRVLERGGNAFDAAACAGFVLQVVEPHLNGPGGDAPIILARHDDPAPTVICGQGPAPAAATIEAFRARGLELIPGTGLLAAVVPGAYGAWLTMLRDYGTVCLRDILEPAIHYARQGHPLLRQAANTIASVQSLFAKEWTTSAALYLQQGHVPQAGALFRNPVLADFYDRVVAHAEGAGRSREAEIDAALSFWYEGEVADTVDRFCRQTEAMDVSGKRHAGLLSGDDLSGWRPPVEKPLSIDQGDYELFKCGPWSQGPSLLQSARMLEGLGIEALDPESPDYVHLVTETVKLSMADRDAWYGDREDVPMETLLSRDYAETRRALIGQEPAGTCGREPQAA